MSKSKSKPHQQHAQQNTTYKPFKTKKKLKNKKRQSRVEEEDIKEEDQKQNRRKTRSSKSKGQSQKGKAELKKQKKKKKKMKKSDNKEQQIESKKKNKKGISKLIKFVDQDENKIQPIDIDSIKFESEFEDSQKDKKSTEQSISKKQFVSFEDSQKIIQLFSQDAGDYKGLRSQFPHIPQKTIRNHLKDIFTYCLNKITETVQQGGRKIKEWEAEEKREIIRELHRIRSSNRLLSEANVEFRRIFHKMMQTFNRPCPLSHQEITFLYRKIQAFVRGFNQITFFRKNYYVPPDQEDERRKPIIEGGYIMEQRMIREKNKLIEKQKPKPYKIDPEKLINEWSQEEEQQICQLFLHNLSYEFIIQNLRAKFGDSDKWKDFQILGKKVDQIIKLGLNRLQEITQKPYNKEEQKIEDLKRAKQREEDRQILQRIRKLEPEHGLKEMIEYSRRPKIEIQSSIIKNPSLLLRQVFAHPGQSYKVKQVLIKLLVEKYPEQEEVENILKTIKQFTQWASREEDINHVTLVRARLPVLEDGSRTKSYASFLNDQRSIFSMKHQDEDDQAQVAMGLSMLQNMQEQEEGKVEEKEEEQYNLSNHSQNSLILKHFNGKSQFKMINSKSHHSVISRNSLPQEPIQVYESEEDEYEGFINNPNIRPSKS